jgi:hypothetical protein
MRQPHDPETIRIELELIGEMMTVLDHFTYSTVHEINRRRGDLISIKYHYLEAGKEIPLPLWVAYYEGARDWVIRTMANALKAGL